MERNFVVQFFRVGSNYLRFILTRIVAGFYIVFFVVNFMDRMEFLG